MSPCSGKTTRSDSSTSGICIPVPPHRSFNSSSMNDACRRNPDRHRSQLASAQLAAGHPGVEHEGRARRLLASPLFPPSSCGCRKGDNCTRCFERTACLCRQDWERRYHPFNFKRSITAFDVEISEEMYIITKESAEAYEQAATQSPTQSQSRRCFHRIVSRWISQTHKRGKQRQRQHQSLQVPKANRSQLN